MVMDADEKRLRWRLRRGMRELDLMLNRFYDLRGKHLDSQERQVLVQLLECEDDRLWDWLNGRSRSEDPELQEMVDAIRGNPFN